MEKKKCPFGKCSKCVWFREFRLTNNETGEIKLFEQCGIEVLLSSIPDISRAVDGCQQASNEARNRTIELQGQHESFMRGINHAIRNNQTDIGAEKQLSPG